VAYRAGAVVRRHQLTWFDRAGGTKGTIGDPDETLDAPRIARDGRVLLTRQSQGNTDIWILDGARASRMTFDKTNDGFPVWSPEGGQIAFSSERNKSFDLFRKSTNGAGVEELLVHSDQSKVPTSWSPDGRYLLYFSVDPNNSPDLWVLPMTGERKPYVLLKTAFTEAMGQFSPDGKWVAYESDETGRYEIYVRPFVPPAANGRSTRAVQGQWAISTAGGVHPVWRADGKEIYYISPQGEMMAAPITAAGSTFVPGIPIKLFATRIVGGGIQAQQVAQFDVAKDGRFLINTELDSSTVPPITLLQNWNPDGAK
jgi:Tol biopolymer transport system component